MHCWSLEGFYCPVDKLFCEWRKPLCSHLCGTLLQTAFGLFDLGSVFWLMQVTLLLDLIFLKENYWGLFKSGLSWCWEGWWSGFQLSMLSLCCQPELDLVPQSRFPRLPQMMEPGVCVPVTSPLLFILLASFVRLDLLKGFMNSWTWEGCWVARFIWRPPDCVCRPVTKFPLSIH